MEGSSTNTQYPYNGIIAIRRETKSKLEARAAVTPDDVKLMIAQGVKILVQPSPSRIFPDREYELAGATVTEDISAASVIVGLKELAKKDVIPGKTYFIFSHTFKRQAYNMGMLRDFIDSNMRLIDYELITDEKNNRLIAFGFHAGLAGTLDMLYGLGRYFQLKGYISPFFRHKPAYLYKDMAEIDSTLESVGHDFKNRLHPHIAPLVFGVLGNGRVASGVLYVLDRIPHVRMPIRDVKKLFDSNTKEQLADKYADKVIVAVIDMDELYVPVDNTKSFEFADFNKNPQTYKSGVTPYLPYINVIFNAVFWKPEFPRFITDADLKDLPHSIYGLCDISADPCGSVECLKKCTTMYNPFYYWDYKNGRVSDGLEQEDYAHKVFIYAVDYCPTEISRISSTYFSELFHKLLLEMHKNKGELADYFKTAMICENKGLTDKYKYILE